MRRKIFISGLMLIFFSSAALAQGGTNDIDSIKNEVKRINQVFDSSLYIGFTVNFLYYTDTSALGHFQRSERDAQYELNAKNFYYKSEDLEYMQNDSFVVNIDNSDKTMIALKNGFANPSSSFLLSSIFDSTSVSSPSVYQFSMTDIDSTTRQITLQTSDPSATYNKMLVTYDTETHYPIEIIAGMSQLLVFSDTSSVGGLGSDIDSVYQRIKLTFSDYRGISTGKIFDADTYFYKDRITKKYVPADKYKYYQFITAGIEGDDADDDAQLLQDNTKQ